VIVLLTMAKYFTARKFSSVNRPISTIADTKPRSVTLPLLNRFCHWLVGSEVLCT